MTELRSVMTFLRTLIKFRSSRHFKQSKGFSRTHKLIAVELVSIGLNALTLLQIQFLSTESVSKSQELYLYLLLVLSDYLIARSAYTG